jgi:hypothetical protein
MASHRFTLVLDVPGIDDAIENRLHKTGCNDALLSQSEGTVTLQFDREAPSFDEAVRSAIKAVESCGVGARCLGWLDGPIPVITDGLLALRVRYALYGLTREEAENLTREEARRRWPPVVGLPPK